MKHCNKCDTTKDLTEFSKKSEASDGLQALCKDCVKVHHKKHNPKHNPNRMFIRGIGYISKKDIRFKDIWKPGNYKSVMDVASLNAVETVKAGHVYIIYNHTFEGWFKVGCALDAKDRLKNFQTASPFRDYSLMFYEDFDDRKSAEKLIHDKLKSHPRLVQWNYEWFMIEPSIIKKVILDVKQETTDARHRDEHGPQYNLGLRY